MESIKKTLVHCNHIRGHQLEYLHHLYIGALEREREQFVFIVPYGFSSSCHLLDWPKANNIIIKEMSEKESSTKGGKLKTAFLNAQSLAKYTKAYHATDVLLISLMSYMPFLPLLLGANIRVKGIIYSIYLYEWNNENYWERFLNVLKYTIFSKCKVFSKVFILNDNSASCYLQKKYKTPKFQYLVDPVASLQCYQPKIIRDKLGISKSQTVFLHPGGMQPYKGTINILKALDSLPAKECQKIAVVFAGRKDMFAKDFDYYLGRIKQKGLTVILLEGFLSFEQLADLFASCDFVLIPYLTNSQSSGIMGHAAYHKKPVIAVQGGVIGKTVKRWKLGHLLESSTVENIKNALLNIAICKPIEGENYTSSHSVNEFNQVIMD